MGRGVGGGCGKVLRVMHKFTTLLLTNLELTLWVCGKNLVRLKLLPARCFLVPLDPKPILENMLLHLFSQHVLLVTNIFYITSIASTGSKNRDIYTKPIFVRSKEVVSKVETNLSRFCKTGICKQCISR